MNLAKYVAQLTTEVPALQQIITADPGVLAVTYNGIPDLIAATTAAVSGRVYNLEMPQDPTYPNLVFQLAGRQPQLVDGVHVSQSDTFVLYVRAETPDELATVRDAVAAGLNAAALAFEIQDELWDYDDKQLVYRANLEISLSLVASTSQTLPAAVVHTLGTDSDRAQYSNRIKQRSAGRFAVTILTDGGNLDALIDAVQDALLGFQVDANHEPVEHVRGRPLDGGGGLSIWQEVYNDATYIAEVLP